MKFDRLEKIEKALNFYGSVTVKQLAEELNVPWEIIRKNLDYLTANKKW